MDFWKYLHPLLKTDNDSRYSTANYAVLKSLADSLSDEESDTLSKKIQLIFETATGDYLDEYGKWFGVSRYHNEDDNDYRERIKYYLLIPRSTIQGIIQGIQYYLDDSNAQISVYEPWKNIFYLNKSNLNGDDHLPGFYYRYAVINVSIDRSMSQAIYDAIQAFKPAGVKFYVTINENLSVDTKPLILADLQSKNMEMVNQMYGFNYKQKIPVTFADRSDTLVDIEDYFKTNNSDLNSKDVLAGSPTHNVTYWNLLKTSNSQYKDVPVNFAIASHASGSNTTSADAYPIHMQLSEDLSGKTITTTVKVIVTNYKGKIDPTNSRGPYIDVKDGLSTGNWAGLIDQIPITGNGVYTLGPKTTTKRPLTGTLNEIGVEMFNMNATIEIWIKLEIGTIASPWSPNPADPEYYEATDVQRSILSNDNYPYVTLPYSSYEKYPVNLLTGTSSQSQVATGGDWLINTVGHFNGEPGKQYTASVKIEQLDNPISFQAWGTDSNGQRKKFISATSVNTAGKAVFTFIAPETGDYSAIYLQLAWTSGNVSGSYSWSEAKAELGDTASPWSPNPADPGYYLNMIDGQLSIYNLLTNKYAGLLNTYAGSTGYDKVKSLIADSNVSLGIIVNTDNPISINGTNISKGKQSVIIDKSSVVYTASDIYIPVTVTGTSDTNIHYLVANIQVKKQVPGMGVKVISSQVDTTIAKS